MTTTELAPFTITFHDEYSSWHESPVLKALVSMTVVITTKEGYIFDAVVRSLNNDGTLTVENHNVGSWTEMTLTLSEITNIHYC